MTFVLSKSWVESFKRSRKKYFRYIDNKWKVISISEKPIMKIKGEWHYEVEAEVVEGNLYGKDK